MPLGTQMPTESSGSQRRSETIPGAASTDGVERPLRLAERPDGENHRAERLEHIVFDHGISDRFGRDPESVRPGTVEALGPLEQSLVASRPDIGDDRRDDGDGLVEPCPSHGTSRSIGRTRIDVAPASRSAGRSDQTSSAATAA